MWYIVMNRILKKQRYTNTLTTVSIVTISQLSRAACLQQLYRLILAQDYHQVIEWVIVEGSKTKEESDLNATHIHALIMNHMNTQRMQETTRTKKTTRTKRTKETTRTMAIRYITYTGFALSDLRNSGNRACKGDIIVVMDDDDYYPSMRISHAVNKLIQSDKQIAGCSPMYVYNYITEQLYQFHSFHSNHSTNNCFAFKREYLKRNAHASGLTYGEEPSFTNHFQEPMVQLDPRKCIVVSSHETNTFDKRPLLAASMQCDPQYIFSIMSVQEWNDMKRLFT